MNAPVYTDICEGVYERLMAKLVKGPSGHHFAVNGTAKEVLDDYTLRRFFLSLDLVPEYDFGSPEESNESYLTRMLEEKDLYNFLATLIYANCSVRAARTFTTELLINILNHRKAWKLPVSEHDLDELFGEMVDVHKFLKNQACFCPMVIRKRQQIRIEDTEKQRLPYLEETLLGSGSYGTVYKVKIAAGHFVDTDHESPYANPIVVARKDYTISQKLAHEKKHETEIMRQILSARLTCENVVESLGSFAVGPSTYSLFMPLAECDLWGYMTVLSPAAPNLKLKPSILFSAQGLADGLHFLHTGIQTREGEKLVCYHMDLKPTNILVFRKDSGNSEGSSELVWKISDFGMARVKRVETSQSGSDGVGEKDFNSWFVRRKQPAAPSGTENRHGEGTYLAPESVTANRNMRTNSDVWSLGCVMSVLFAYLEDGARGVNAYSDRRLDDSKSQGYDRFFVRNSIFNPVQVNPAVERWHANLVVKARHRSPQEGQAVEFMLSHLEKEVFRDQMIRCEVIKLKEVIQETHRRYRELQTPLPPAPPKPPGKSISELRNQVSNWKPFGRKKSNSFLEQPVYKWVLTSPEPFKGSAISPDGTVVAFWTDFTISLYIDASLHPAEGNGVASTAEAVAHYEISDNILDTVRVTNNVLIASTSAANFECYVFDLQDGDSAGESLIAPQRVTFLAIPRIQRLAISPDSSTVAFILRDSHDEKNPGSLYSAPIRFTPTRTICQPEFKAKMTLGWPAADAVRLSFSTDNNIWIVFRPHISTHDWDHKTQIIHVSLRERKWDHLKIQLKSPDGNHQVGLYTTFAPFIDPPNACAVVTREERLHIESFDQGRMLSVEADIHNYRILTLMMGWDGKRLFAIGKKLASHKILLLEMNIPAKANKGVEVTELAALPDLSDDDDFTVKLSSRGNEKFVLLAARIKRDQRAIYKIPII